MGKRNNNTNNNTNNHSVCTLCKCKTSLGELSYIYSPDNVGPRSYRKFNISNPQILISDQNKIWLCRKCNANINNFMPDDLLYYKAEHEYIITHSQNNDFMEIDQLKNIKLN